MILDFKEIPAGNAESQGDFEQFAKEFLQVLDFHIVRKPGSGADNGQDLIVEKEYPRETTKKRVRYLVSCKHFAHRNHGKGKSIGVGDEISIRDRVEKFGCDAFMGFYSTAASQGLIDHLEHGKGYDHVIFNNWEIEKELLEHCNTKANALLLRFFPVTGKKMITERAQNKSNESIGKGNDSPPLESDKHLEVTQTENNPIPPNHPLPSQEFDQHLEVTLTAMILLKIDRIEEKYLHSEWDQVEHGLDKLRGFVRYNNPKLATRIFELLVDLSGRARHGMPKEISFDIFSQIVEWYTGPSEDAPNLEVDRLASTGMNVGFDITYDAMIHLRDLRVAMDGLVILKYFYWRETRYGTPGLKDKVLWWFNYLEQNLRRPERNDLEPARRLLQVFKDDLEYPDPSYPPLPKDLAHLI